MTVRDTLLRAAEAGLYRPYWSEEILEELRRNLALRPRVGEAGTQRLLRALRTAFPEASARVHRRIVNSMTNAPEDRHVLAAAVVTRAQVIVTFNLRDFPSQALAPFDIAAQDPDTFLIDLWGAHAPVMARMIVQQAADLGDPPLTPADVLASLAQHAPRFAAAARRYLEQGPLPEPTD